MICLNSIVTKYTASSFKVCILEEPCGAIAFVRNTSLIWNLKHQEQERWCVPTRGGTGRRITGQHSYIEFNHVNLGRKMWSPVTSSRATPERWGYHFLNLPLMQWKCEGNQSLVLLRKHDLQKNKDTKWKSLIIGIHLDIGFFFPNFISRKCCKNLWFELPKNLG